jgi:hypothetical protein
MSNRKLQELKREKEKQAAEDRKRLQSLLASTVSGSARNLQRPKQNGMPSLMHRSSNQEVHRPAVAVAMDFAAKKKAQVYTGDKMIGIGQLHKSNAVPIFSQQEAIEVSTMRRN